MWTTIAFMADGHGRSMIAWDSLVRRPRDLALPPIDRALDVPHGRAETAARGACSYKGECGCGTNGARIRGGVAVYRCS
jgi:hypothetical protein